MKPGKKKSITGVLPVRWALALLFLGSAPALSQPPDTLQTAAPDTVLTDAAADTLLLTLPPPRGSQVEGPVRYWAEDIDFSLPEQTTRLEGNAKIVYQNVTLTAGKIEIFWERNRLAAEGLADSTDSLGNPVYRGLPVLTEKGEEPIRGFRLEYDFANNRGKVLEGRTDMEPGHYHGKDVRKIGRETLLIEDGYFTTCDNEEHPHYYFRSSKMRVRVKKQAVVKPVILYIADVPVLAAPFAVFSLQRGRRSGIIIPKFGQTNFGGRYLQDFGYYWAPSQYWDVTALATFYEKTGMVYNGQFQYNKRYIYNGRVNGSYSPKDVRTGQRVQRWQIGFDHFHQVSPTFTITGNGRFVSDQNFLRDYYSDFDQRTNQTLTTNVSAKKTLPGSRTLSLNMRRTENLQTGRLDYDFPDLQFRQPALSLFPAKTSRPAWYNNIRYSYNSSLKANGSKIPVIDQNTGQTLRFERSSASGWVHDVVPSFSTKVLKYFNLSPSLQFQELWVKEYLNYRFVDSLNTVVADTVQGFRARHLVTGIGLRTSTTFYGLWEMPFTPLKVIRHKIDPAIGFSFQPDYSDPGYGYYQSFTDTTGRTIRADRFVKNAFGSRTPQGKVSAVTIGINNLFQGKLLRKEEEKKINLFQLDFNTVCNFARDSLQWSDLSTTFQAKPINRLNIRADARHSFYKKSPDGRGRVNEFVWSDRFALPDLLNWNVNVNYGLSLRPPSPKVAAQAPADTLPEAGEEYSFLGDDTDILASRDFEEFKGLDIPWSVDLNFSYSYSDNGQVIARRFDASTSARLRLTKNWNISYSNRVNLEERELVDQRFQIERDLHCWVLNFQWSPNPNFGFYRLEIRIKETILRDLKVTKTATGRPF